MTPIASRTSPRPTKRQPSRQSFDVASAFADRHLLDIYRRSGESYADHGKEVAQVIQEFWPGSSLTNVAVLHDILVHPDGEKLLKGAPLSERERNLVKTMYTLRRLHIDANTRDLDTVIEAFTQHEELLPLRMAHRHNDVRHLDRFEPKLRKQIAHESLHMYAAIAGRLGMQRLRQEMEDMCFHWLHPSIARTLHKQFMTNRSLDEVCMSHTATYLSEKLSAVGIAHTIEHRIKGLYSTYRKMAIRRRRFRDLTDRIALRICVEKVEDCYRALGIIHGAMRPMPGKLKDYIGAPKENGYQSIHTVVFPLPGITDQPIEIQIRTQEMHTHCEYGSLSHHSYKSQLYALHAGPTRVNLLRNLLSLHEEAPTPKEFTKVLRTYFREDHMMIFDADNVAHTIRKSSSVMDFCCTAYGHRCRRLKSVTVNGRRRSLESALHDGDTVKAFFARKNVLSEEAPRWCRQPVLRRRLADFLGLRGNHGTKTLVR